MQRLVSRLCAVRGCYINFKTDEEDCYFIYDADGLCKY